MKIALWLAIATLAYSIAFANISQSFRVILSQSLHSATPNKITMACRLSFVRRFCLFLLMLLFLSNVERLVPYFHKFVCHLDVFIIVIGIFVSRIVLFFCVYNISFSHSKGYRRFKGRLTMFLVASKTFWGS